MQQYINTVQNRSGAAVSSASVLVKTYPGAVNATIYSDDGVTEATNPLTTDANGQFTFYAADGRYSLTISKTGVITQRTIDDILLQDPDDGTAEQSAADVFFAQSGSGALASETVQDTLRRLVHTAQYDTEANFNTAQAALTGTFGMHEIQVGGYPLGTNSGSFPLRIVTTDTSAGDFVIALWDYLSNGDRNNVLLFGYNVKPGGTFEDETEPCIYLSFESHYNNGSAELLEYHIAGTTPDGTGFRHQSVTIDRNTNRIVGFFDADQFSFSSADHTTQAFIFTLDDDLANWSFSVRTGAYINCAVNNQNWIRQINAAGATYLELIRLDASDKLVLKPAAGVVSEGSLQIRAAAQETPRSIEVYGTYGSATNFHNSGWKTAYTTLSDPSGATVTATGLIPAGSFLLGVTTRISNGNLGTGSGTTGYTVGDGVDADLWGVRNSIWSGQGTDMRDYTAAGASGVLYTAAQDVVITAVGGNFDGSAAGDFQIVVNYFDTRMD